MYRRFPPSCAKGGGAQQGDGKKIIIPPLPNPPLPRGEEGNVSSFSSLFRKRGRRPAGRVGDNNNPSPPQPSPPAGRGGKCIVVFLPLRRGGGAQQGGWGIIIILPLPNPPLPRGEEGNVSSFSSLFRKRGRRPAGRVGENNNPSPPQPSPPAGRGGKCIVVFLPLRRGGGAQQGGWGVII